MIAVQRWLAAFVAAVCVVGLVYVFAATGVYP